MSDQNGHQAISVYDKSRKRHIPLEIFVPHIDGPVPIAIFSHGRGYSPQPYRYLGQEWSSRGLLVVMPHHRGRTESPEIPGFCGERVNDILFVASQLKNVLEKSRFREDVPIGVAGHSLGAVTALMLAGARLRYGNRVLKVDGTLGDAFVAIGPPYSPASKFSHTSWKGIKRPLFLMDPTDISTNGPLLPRKKLFRQIPHKKKTHVILESANHYEFMNCFILDPKSKNIESLPDPKSLRAIARQTAAFWRTHLGSRTH